jgi:hypothetical protein
MDPLDHSGPISMQIAKCCFSGYLKLDDQIGSCLIYLENSQYEIFTNNEKTPKNEEQGGNEGIKPSAMQCIGTYKKKRKQM